MIFERPVLHSYIPGIRTLVEYVYPQQLQTQYEMLLKECICLIVI